MAPSRCLEKILQIYDKSDIFLIRKIDVGYWWLSRRFFFVVPAHRPCSGQGLQRVDG